MRTLLLTLLIATAVLPLASADHGCSSESSTQTQGTVTIEENAYSCHYTYFGTGYYYESSWGQESTRVSESTTGAELGVHTYSAESEYVSQTSGSSESISDQAVISAQVAGQHTYVGVADGQSSSTSYGCYGVTSAQASTYSSDGQTGAYRSLNRGDLSTLPCVPPGLRTML